jgi:uncharacterized BrkB/YihY/UPF0761 family membrane protein
LQSQSDRDPRWLMLILWLIGVVAPVGFTIWILYAAYYWPARLHEMRAPRAISQGDALRSPLTRSWTFVASTGYPWGRPKTE